MRKKVLVRGPALSRSGYGEQTRFALRSLQRFEDRFDIYLINTTWGATSWMAADTPERRWFDFLLKKTIVASQNGPFEFDISIQVTIPNEWEELAPINIGFTAGIEANRITPVWVEKANLMDHIIVVSHHAKAGFVETSYEAQNRQTGEHIPDFRCTTPVTVANFPAREFKGVDLDLDITTSFNFLTVAQNGPRKNMGNTINWFVEEFKDEPDVGLVLKIFNADNSTIDFYRTKDMIDRTTRAYPDMKCSIYLCHGEMTDEELHGLYTHPAIKGLVSIAHGEGFGLPLFEAVCSGLPVIAPEWGGPLDFLYAPVKKKGSKRLRMRPHFLRVDYDLHQVQPEAHWEGVIQPESAWTFSKEASYRSALRGLLKNHKMHVSRAKKLQKHILEKISFDNQSEIFANAVLETAGDSVEPPQDTSKLAPPPPSAETPEKSVITFT